jgi:retron-type reverse transcriptase
VKALQHLLTHSFSGKAIAVKRVTENRGKKTPGVDGEVWSTPASKSQALISLKRRGYKPLPLRRIYIPKANGKKQRPLGIPAMKDRAMQALYLLALNPLQKLLQINTLMGSAQKGPPLTRSNNAMHACHESLMRNGSSKQTSKGALTT